MVATEGYAPAEQYTTSQEQTPATDLYSFGMTLYHLMAPQEKLPHGNDRSQSCIDGAPDPLKPIRTVAKGYSEALYKTVEACCDLSLPWGSFSCGAIRW